MQNQVRPTYQTILKLSIGLGGMFHALFVPVLAEAGEEGFAPQDTAYKVGDRPSQSHQQSQNTVKTGKTHQRVEVSGPLPPRFSTADQPSKADNALDIDKTQAASGDPLDCSSLELAWTDRTTLEAQKQWLKALVGGTPCNVLPVASNELLKTEDSQQSLAPGIVKEVNEDCSDEDSAEEESSVEVINVVDTHGQDSEDGSEEDSSEDCETQENGVETGGLEEALLENSQPESNQSENNQPENSQLENGQRENSEGTEPWFQDLPGFVSEQPATAETDEALDDELGTLRLFQLRSRENEELGILRLLQTAEATPPPPKPPIAFLTGRLGFFDTQNAFRSEPSLDEQIYQSGLTFYLFPKLSESTSLYGIAETNLARYENFDSVNYNELEVQLGIRQRLARRTYAQLGWRNQRLYSPGYREELFNVHYIDSLISHRSVLNSKTWLDSFYQMRLGFADPDVASRLRQTFTLSLNYGATRDLRTSLIYQLDFDDYTQVSRFDTYQQVLGIISYNLTPESRLTLFGGTRFGRSSISQINLNDTFYGAGLNVNVPLF